jgi:glutathione S-transferase
LQLAGVDFDDHRIRRELAGDEGTHALRPLPVLDLPGHPPLAQTNAILVLIGRRHGLHPADDFEAARHEGMMQHVEDLRATVGPTIRMGDAEKKTAREALVAAYLPAWGHAAERNIASGPYFAGERIQVVDVKLHMAVRWFLGGNVDHIPASIFAAYPKLMGVHDAVREHPRIKAWYGRD